MSLLKPLGLSPTVLAGLSALLLTYPALAVVPVRGGMRPGMVRPIPRMPAGFHGAGFRPGFTAIRPMPPTAARSSFLIPNRGFTSHAFPRPFGLASNNALASGLVGANIPRPFARQQFALQRGFGSPFFNPFLANSFGTGFNPAFGQTAFNTALGGFPFTGGSSLLFTNQGFNTFTTRPNLTAGLASANPAVTANALGVLARNPNLFNSVANANPFLVANALGTLSANPNAFTGLVGTNPLVAGAFANVAANPGLLRTFVHANPFVFANASLNPNLFNALSNANPALANQAVTPFASPFLTPLNSFGAGNSFAFGGGGLGLGYNPYLASLYSGYGLGGYGMGGMGGYGSGGSGGSSNSATSAATQAQNYINEAQMASQPRESTNVLSAYGVPNNEGRVHWPVGLRVLGPSMVTDPLRQKIDSLVAGLVTQKVQYGRADASLLEEANRAIDSLRQQLADHSTDLSHTSYEDSRVFLTRLQDALKKMD